MGTPDNNQNTDINQQHQRVGARETDLLGNSPKQIKIQDCRLLWRHYDEEANVIAGVEALSLKRKNGLDGAESQKLDKIIDDIKGFINDKGLQIPTIQPIPRNKKITAAYARLFLANEKLLWAGAAAFASKQIGCAMSVLLDDKMLDKLISVPDFLSTVPTQMLKDHFADRMSVVYSYLAAGNLLIFKDIYPVHRFYEDNGFDKLRLCANERNPPVHPKILGAFELFEQGNLDSEEGRRILTQGAMLVAEYEQGPLTQESIFMPLRDEFINMQFFSKFKFLGIPGIYGNFTDKCIADKIETIEFDDYDYSDYNKRMVFVRENIETFSRIARDSQVISALRLFLSRVELNIELRDIYRHVG